MEPERRVTSCAGRDTRPDTVRSYFANLFPKRP